MDFCDWKENVDHFDTACGKKYTFQQAMVTFDRCPNCGKMVKYSTPPGIEEIFRNIDQVSGMFGGNL